MGGRNGAVGLAWRRTAREADQGALAGAPDTIHKPSPQAYHPPPSVSILLEFEHRAPRSSFTFVNDAGEARMRDWLLAHPQLLALIRRAVELEREERAA